jgi:hypothetical protein
VPICIVGGLENTRFLPGPQSSRSTWMVFGAKAKTLLVWVELSCSRSAFDRVDADLRITGGDLTLGLRTTPEAVRLRIGVGAGDSLDLMDKAEMGDLVETGCEDGRRCGVAFVFWSCWISGFRRDRLDEDSEAGINDFALTC